MHTGPWKWHPSFPYFFSDLLPFFSLHSLTFNIWKYALDPENSTHHPLFFLIFPLFYCYFSFFTASLSIFGNVHWTQKSALTIPYFFLIFSLFYCHFSFCTASLSIFGNAHWTLKRHPPTSSSTVNTTPYFFLEFSPILSLFFIGKSAHFHIWKCAFGP